MSERPTPETDAALYPMNQVDIVWPEFARRLERERDEAREDAEHWKIEYEIVVSRLCGNKHPRDNGIIFEHEIIPKLERELAKAREELKKLEGAYEDATNYYARMIELREELDQVKEELKNKTYDQLKS